jgi:membrane protease YdiL (CAAX protease family)
MNISPEQPSSTDLSNTTPAAPATPYAQDATPYTQDLSPSTQAPQPERNPVFFGVFGLRAGWSLLIYLAIIGVIVGSFYFVGHQVYQQAKHDAAVTAAKTGKPAPPVVSLMPKPDPSQPEPLSAIIAGEAVLFGGFLLLSVLMAVIERRKLSAFGLGGTHPISRFFVGAFWGIAAISLLILTLRSFHLLTFDARLDYGPSILFWGLLQLAAFFFVGLTEEYTTRGYLQFTLTRGLVSVGNLISPARARAIAFWIASVLTSAFFLYAHTRNAGENWLGLFQVFLVGLVFVVALWRTGSLWWGIGFHMAWDWGQSFLYGVPDSGGLMQGRLFATHSLGKSIYSGGTVGPEGSILCVPILLLIILVLLNTHPSPQPPLEPNS